MLLDNIGGDDRLSAIGVKDNRVLAGTVGADVLA